MIRSLLVGACLLGLVDGGTAQETPAQLAAQARAILETNCHRCHGKDGSKEGGFGYVLDVKQMVERKRVVPRLPEKSRILTKALLPEDDDECMPPPKEKPRPSKKDLDVLRRWIAAGAPEFPAAETARRSFVSETDVYQAMHQHLFGRHPEQARFQRYLTLTHLHNNPLIKDEQLRFFRAGVAKLLNSLSWKRALVMPQAIDAHGTVLAFDLRDLDWDLNHGWNRLIGKDQVHPGYPYGLTHERYPEDEPLNRLADQVYKLAGTKMPAVRADWFLATASLPPLYHELLEIPDHADPLERRLAVNVAANFQRDKLARAGFSESGVSAKANRLVERHEAAFGMYWKSYDFKTNEGRGNLFLFPLGPLNLFERGKHPYAEQAFVHDGGELIWALPNGLHAYMLIDKDHRRIDEGPTEIVRDKNETAGRGPAIVNGLSCMACHRHGMIEFQDSVREGAGLLGLPRDQVRRLYPLPKAMQALVQADEDAYLESLEKVVGPYLRIGPDRDKPLKDFPEVVSALAGPFLKGSVKLEEAAHELGLTDPRELRVAIANNPDLRDRLGLRPWLNGDMIRRAVWHSVQGFYSPFQETAQALHRGTPYRVRRSDTP